MNGWGHAAKALVLVAPPIAAIDVLLSRRQAAMISHHWWNALEYPGSRALMAGVWTMVTVHLFRPEHGRGDRFRDSWRTGARVGLAVAGVVRFAFRS